MIVHTFDELQQALRQGSGSVGLVPTMGFLHEGHLSLIRLSVSQNARTVVTIFVNPTQFGPSEDLDKYPRDLGGDLRRIATAGECLVWAPSVTEMYPDGFQTWVEVTELTKTLEGGRRPGHFKGVTTVVSKLFNAIRPDKAYFGQKDLQQVTVLQRLARDLSYPIEIVIGPTVREPDGLAMSSRNSYLSDEERLSAMVLNKALTTAKLAFEQGERNAGTLVDMVRELIATEPLANIQYISCSDLSTLLEVKTIEGPAAISLAVYFGKTRLIDNVILK